MTRRLSLIATAALAWQALAALPCFGDEADDWNALAERVSVQSSPSPAAALQAQSMVRCALERALKDGAVLGRADAAQLAAAVAAHDVLCRLYPERCPEFDMRLKGLAETLKRGTPVMPAVQAGRSAAAQAMTVSYPRRLEAEQTKGPRGYDPSLRRLELPAREPRPLQPARVPVRPVWRDRHAIEL